MSDMVRVNVKEGMVVYRGSFHEKIFNKKFLKFIKRKKEAYRFLSCLVLMRLLKLDGTILFLDMCIVLDLSVEDLFKSKRRALKMAEDPNKLNKMMKDVGDFLNEYKHPLSAYDHYETDSVKKKMSYKDHQALICYFFGAITEFDFYGHDL